VIAFCDRALHDDRMAAVHETVMPTRLAQMHGYLQQAREDGDATTATPDEAVIDGLLAALMGLQINALFAPSTTPQRREAVLDELLGALAP